MATQKQVEYVMSLQEQLELEDCEKYTDEQVKAMSHKEVSNVIENYKTSIRNEELYDECMSFIKERLENTSFPTKAFYILNDDMTMTLIWKDGELVE